MQLVQKKKIYNESTISLNIFSYSYSITKITTKRHCDSIGLPKRNGITIPLYKLHNGIMILLCWQTWEKKYCAQGRTSWGMEGREGERRKEWRKEKRKERKKGRVLIKVFWSLSWPIANLEGSISTSYDGKETTRHITCLRFFLSRYEEDYNNSCILLNQLHLGCCFLHLQVASYTLFKILFYLLDWSIQKSKSVIIS